MINSRAENSENGSCNAKHPPFDIARQPPSEEDEEDVLEEEGTPPDKENGGLHRGVMGIDMDEFSRDEGNEDDGKAEPTTGAPGIVEIGTGVFGDEFGALEAG